AVWVRAPPPACGCVAPNTDHSPLRGGACRDPAADATISRGIQGRCPQYLTAPGSPTTLWRAIDLAVALDDPELRGSLRSAQFDLVPKATGARGGGHGLDRSTRRALEHRPASPSAREARLRTR